MSSLVITPLFQALARPPMLNGVTYSFMLVNLMTHTIGFVALPSFWLIGSFVVFHCLGKVFCRVDPSIFDIFLGYIQHSAVTNNNDYWKGSCYEPS